MSETVTPNEVRRLVDLFGGSTALGRIVGRKPSVVNNWIVKNSIPWWYRKQILRAAVRNSLIIPMEVMKCLILPKE